MKNTIYSCDRCIPDLTQSTTSDRELGGWVMIQVFEFVSNVQPKFLREEHVCPRCARGFRREQVTIPELDGKTTSPAE